MVNLLKISNKRKREIERLNTVINGLVEKNGQFERSVRLIKAERDLSERALKAANKARNLKRLLSQQSGTQPQKKSVPTGGSSVKVKKKVMMLLQANPMKANF